MKRAAVVLVLALGLAGAALAVQHARRPALPAWEPAVEEFRGCEGGCGTRGQNDLSVVQPGAAVGQLAYCPVSGVVFSVKDDGPVAMLDGKPLHFCCEACARKFAESKDEVRSRRGL